MSSNRKQLNKSDVIMNKQFHSHSYPGAQDVELIGYREVDLDAGPFQRPEISIFPAENSEHVEIDSCTGLPKLPVEPPAPPSPEALRSTTKVSSLLSSVLKMANSPSKRKSVTFDPSAGDENERASSGPGVSLFPFWVLFAGWNLPVKCS